MSDHSDYAYSDDADAAGKQDETMDSDALRDQDLDHAAGGLRAAKTGGDAGSASDWQGKNDKPESDAHAR